MIIFLLIWLVFIALIVVEVLLFRYTEQHQYNFKNEKEMTKEELKEYKKQIELKSGPQ